MKNDILSSVFNRLKTVYIESLIFFIKDKNYNYNNFKQNTAKIESMNLLTNQSQQDSNLQASPAPAKFNHTRIVKQLAQSRLESVPEEQPEATSAATQTNYVNELPQIRFR